MTRQPLWVTLCGFQEKGGKEIGESRGDERESTSNDSAFCPQ